MNHYHKTFKICKTFCGLGKHANRLLSRGDTVVEPLPMESFDGFVSFVIKNK